MKFKKKEAWVGMGSGYLSEHGRLNKKEEEKLAIFKIQKLSNHIMSGG